MLEFNSEQPNLIDCIVCNIDILGFTEMILKAYKKSLRETNILLRKINNVISNYEKKLLNEYDNSKIKIFTDNIISAFPVKKQSNIIGLMELIDAIERHGLYQFRLAIEGFFIRGGVSYGKHYMNDKIVFGPALIESHHLESELARDPRIILGQDIVENIIKKAYELNQTRRIKKYILLDYDNIMFINYLGVMYEIESDNGNSDLFRRQLYKHKEEILKKLLEFKDQPKILSKYIWTGHYHNYFCSSNFKDERDIRISSSLLKTSPKVIIKRELLFEEMDA